MRKNRHGQQIISITLYLIDYVDQGTQKEMKNDWVQISFHG